ncbi:MAG: LON peptidase substrate-binding domain-containing protein [Phycisphaerales bacterium]|nr:LON peptidase substrate-binding domain-containing protein [Phycisphaerales bacterium]
MAKPIDFSKWIPIFPLPNGVLMPKAILPLHVFEHRYRVMTRDALAGSKLIAMGLLKPGYEANYHRLDTAVYPEVCVGRILREEQLADGRFNLLLQGAARARIEAENAELEYRRGRLECMLPIPASPETECAIRRELRQLLSNPPLVQLATKANWLELLSCPEFSLSDILDVLASTALPSSQDKQRFLAEPCVVGRASCICKVLHAIGSQMPQCAPQKRPRSWPPKIYTN